MKFWRCAIILQPIDATDSVGPEGGVNRRHQHPAAAESSNEAANALGDGVAVAQIGAQHRGQDVSVQQGDRRRRGRRRWPLTHFGRLHLPPRQNTQKLHCYLARKMFSDEPRWQCVMRVPFRLYRRHEDEIWCCSPRSNFVDWEISEERKVSGWLSADGWIFCNRERRV